ncbi:MAG: guanylate kinase [Candidatus Peribacteraceae bacterium]|nr:guanylate kinase [Candidatus Peribacteraceae bacterium]
MNKIYIISGPSGVGKSTIAAAILKAHPNIEESVSYTTRKPRDEEKHGVDYFFVSEDRFNELQEDGEFVESAEVHGKMYGTSTHTIDTLLNAANKNVLIVLDVQGTAIFKDSYPEAISIFIMPPSFHDLEKRMSNRKSETSEELEIRMKNAREEITKCRWYDYVVENDILTEAIKDVEKIIHVESSLRPESFI